VTWGLFFRLRQDLKGSLWALPLLGALAGALIGSGWLFVDRSVDVPAFWQYSPSTATTLLSAIVGASAALTGFVVTVAVLVVQMATGTFSARYLRLWYRDRLLKATLAVLIGTLTFAFQLLRRVDGNFVPDTGITIAGALMGTGVLLFIFFLDRSIKRMRPVAVAALVARAGRKAFVDAVRAAGEPDAPDVLPRGSAPASDATFVVRSDRAGAVQAIDARGLVRWARKHECLLVLQHVAGDFVPSGAPLIEIHGGTADPERAERQLRGMIALGVERTIEQDPAFAVRVMVDIANKALSAAINDPTTAVQVIDHLGETLHLIGTTDLAGLAQHGAGHVQRVIVPTRHWDEFLALGVTEIRYYGGSAIQVVRRLHAMLEELEDAVLPEHRAAVADELARLQKTVEVRFADSADLDRARTAGRQGIGGPTEA
jgi:uncharacterized membrane protein